MLILQQGSHLILICRKFSKYVTISLITLIIHFLIFCLSDRPVLERLFFLTVLQGRLWTPATVLFILLPVSSLILSRAMILRSLELPSLTLHFLLSVTFLLLTTLEQRKLQIIIFLICLILLMKGSRRKSIIISSNLEMPDIETRYSQRIFSRLVSAYSILRLFGDDIRCMKKLSPTKRS